ncbi:hypothetical protein BGZ99_000461 [Dissophora globulifera]|uniref:Fluoride ion transporter CrcB n=1 Tax=Dissophora globulifera TaxID=979702 RepID=A0A9P6R3G0_9FUNG|nr:hypothetical protein BGZ99_000461 [Dissophora globulifera]
MPKGSQSSWRHVVLASCFAPLGAIIRWYLSRFNSKVKDFPIGTFAVNIGGTLLLAAIVCLQHAPGAGGSSALACQMLSGLQDGFCGCLTTISTFALELKTLRRKASYIYGTTSVVVAQLGMLLVLGSFVWTRRSTAMDDNVYQHSMCTIERGRSMTPWVRAAKELEETLNSATEGSGHIDSLDSTYDSAFYSSFAPSTSSICSSPGLAPISIDTRSLIPSAAAINTNTLSHLSYSQPTYHLLPTVIATKTSEFNASLRPRTPLEVVALSNLKLNNDIFSKRSLSIHRRVLVKNLLTLLYEINPMLDWIENSSSLSGALGVPASDNSVSADPPLAEDKQNGRIEQSLYAAGVNGEDGRQPSQELTDADRVARRPWSRGDSKDHNNSTASLTWTAQRSSGEQNTRDVSSPATLRATVVPLPRPKSSELPQSLHSYLSAVFDVDWSVAHSSSEDSLFTSAGSTPSLSSAALSPLSTFSLGTSSAGSSSLAGARSTLSDGYLSSSTVPPSKTSFPSNPAIVTAKDSNQSHKGQRGLSGTPGEALPSLSERLAKVDDCPGKTLVAGASWTAHIDLLTQHQYE